MPVRKKPIAIDNPFFNRILVMNFVVLVLMIGLVVLAVSIEGNPATDMQKGLFEVGRTGVTLLVGTLAGLASAKGGRPTHSES